MLADTVDVLLVRGYDVRAQLSVNKPVQVNLIAALAGDAEVVLEQTGTVPDDIAGLLFGRLTPPAQCGTTARRHRAVTGAPVAELAVPHPIPHPGCVISSP